jgi:hypothetical protein
LGFGGIEGDGETRLSKQFLRPKRRDWRYLKEGRKNRTVRPGLTREIV